MPKVADPQRAAETEAAILEAASDVLAEEGLEALSMRAVGARVGLSATALYNYVQNKQELVDRGADISAFSQYEHEQEILFGPLTSLQVCVLTSR